MKKHTLIPAILVLFSLASGCTLPPVHDPTPRMDKISAADNNSQREKPAPIIHPATKGKRISLVGNNNTTTQAAKENPPAPVEEEQPLSPPQPQSSEQQPQIFTDYNTGLVFTYQQPWHLVSTQGEGSVFGRDDHSQLITRFVTLTTDNEQSSQRGYFYVPEDSLTGKIGKKLKVILGLDDKPPAQRKTPLDVLLTKKHFPNLIVTKRYRGNNGEIIVQKCRHKELPGSFQVYHVFIEDKVASFSLSETKNRHIKLEMQQIALSTRKP